MPVNKRQIILDFDNPPEDNRWPSNKKYPLNLKNYQRTERTVKTEVFRDIQESMDFLIVTGFTSLSNLIDVFGTNEYPLLKKVRIVLGFEPNIRGRKKYETEIKLNKEIKEYWLKKGLSIMLGGAVIRLIEQIKDGKVEFRYRDKLHAKIYVGDRHVTMGSANFSRNGLTTQEEANIRVALFDGGETEGQQYRALKQIAENFYESAGTYNASMITLLENLIGKVTWEEALARAIAEVLEGDWLNEYHELYTRLGKAKLWPTQRKGIAQAMTIIQKQSNVLIADPTGSGKTKFCTALLLTLIHWLWENGKRLRSSSIVICPPLVIPNWRKEFKELATVNHNQISMGILSKGNIKRTQDAIEDVQLTNILTIDEAHNYLNPDSKRSRAIKQSTAEHTILATATPINKKADDLLRLIELLDVDNLSDSDFEVYKKLKERTKRKPVHGDELANLKKFISQFTVRRTKLQLNKEIDKEPEKYLNREGNLCRFPKQNCIIYKTKETVEDIEIAKQISSLIKKLHGVGYLRSFNRPDYELSNEEAEKQFVANRIRAANALSGYMIRSALRSSHVALIEHIAGSDAAMEAFNFKTKKNKTGNVIGKIEGFKDSLPKTKSFPKHCFPEWLVDKDKYLMVCEEDITVYKKIYKLAIRLSGQRELGKVEQLIALQKKHKLMVAFDSTVISLDYFKHLFDKNKSKSKVYVVTGADVSEKVKDEVMEAYALGSKAENCIALCSDKMSEGVNMQQASGIVLLDMPSVLRIAEQRIGRIDRMDSPHSEIGAYWPEDSEVYSLKGDKRLIDTSIMVEGLYGSNLNIPQELKDRHFKDIDSVGKMIDEYKSYINSDVKWAGIHDSFKPIQELKEGDNLLIPEKTYDKIRDVRVTIKTRVGFVSSEASWGFFALRGTKNQSPKWYFIDPDNKIHTEYPDICEQLRLYLGNHVKNQEWDQKMLEHFVKKMQEQERELLPNKRKRALDVAEYILIQKAKREKDRGRKSLMNKLLKLFKPRTKDFIVDYYTFAEQWINVLQPYLEKKRESARRKRVVYNLNHLKREHKKIDLSTEKLQELYDDCPFTENVDSKIAACIIGVGMEV